MLQFTSAIEHKKHKIVQKIQHQSQLYQAEEDVHAPVLVLLIHFLGLLSFLVLPVNQVTFGKIGIHNPVFPIIEEEVMIGLSVEGSWNAVSGQ